MDIKRSEVYRYLGYGRNIPDDKVKDTVEECIDLVLNVADMKSIYRIFDLSVNGDIIEIDGHFKATSKNLSKNLTGCESIVLFGATLGTGVDMLIKKYTKLDMSYAVILQAVSATVIEEYCDICQREIEEKLSKEDKFIRPRFSPGYGDFSIENQKMLVNMLECQKKIGLMLTESLMLVPSKSVTAVMGVSKEKKDCHIKGCEECQKTDCAYRRG
ncbi:MAG: Vitamin B12 dependent methionine synthase activation subunit [Tyzzerella sp.]|uniref:Vitamin B12 dependent methionine synthase activation subunit n=1 Tax=Candidatus Fimicola merdigallinarum TaxID=2840819 RepID=A0A9D9DTW4_9FIRM|nr:Vitamin B12 dependent methionine synthase activation subunit [Candidatus Fimicola merdigallinarum]